MMKTLIALLLTCTVAFCADPPKLPKEPVYGFEGQFISVDAEAIGPVKWYPLDPGLSIVPSDELRNQKRLLATGKAGTYRVIAWTSDKDGPSDPTEVTIVIKPRDNPPTPSDPLTRTLGEALGRESNKSTFKALVPMYADAAAKLRGNSAPETSLDLFNMVVELRRNSEVKDTMPEVRKVVNAMVGNLLGTDTARVLKPSDLESVASLFEQVSRTIAKMETK